MTSEETTVRNHIRENLTPAVGGRRCVDGRYQTGQGDGMIARPGGDLGYVLVLLTVNSEKNLGFTPLDIFERIYNVITRNDSFFIHTDEHAIHDPNSLIGCGHMAKAANREYSHLYNVNPEDVTAVLNKIKELSLKDDSKIENVLLSGEHNEQGVIIVKGTGKTVNQFNPQGEQKSMYFVYDQLRDNEFIKKLIDLLAIPGLTYEDFMEASDRQLSATLELLAKGKPIFEINVDSPTPNIIYKGFV